MACAGYEREKVSCLPRLQLPCFQMDGTDSKLNEEGEGQGEEGEKGEMKAENEKEKIEESEKEKIEENEMENIEENEKDDIITPLPVFFFLFLTCVRV